MTISNENDQFTNAEMNAMIASSAPGSFVALPDLTKIGVIDVAQSSKNFVEGSARSRNALAQGFYIEVINLRVQHTECWLRILYVHSRGEGVVIAPDDRRTFGQVIGDCASLLPPDLLDRLRSFNKSRTEAVHKYLLGGTDYNKLKAACDSSTGLDGIVYNLVLDTVGRPVTSIEGRIGEFVVQRTAISR